jgi:hypothetical protein
MKHAHHVPCSEGRLPPIPAEHLKFESLSEYACCKMLESYTGWRAIKGFTFQVPIGRCSFDFMIGNTLVEYHPISLKREFTTGALKDILCAMHHTSRPNRKWILKSLATELGGQYEKRRRQVAGTSDKYSNCEVVCIFNQEEWCQKILQRFANRPLPPIERLKAEFKQLQKHAASSNLVG